LRWLGVLALASVLMQSLTPVTLSTLDAVELPLAFQLRTPLLGVTWSGWIKRPSAVAGVTPGMDSVLLAEPSMGSTNISISNICASTRIETSP
jgi:SSS family solute:Na+ symporter